MHTIFRGKICFTFFERAWLNSEGQLWFGASKTVQFDMKMKIVSDRFNLLLLFRGFTNEVRFVKRNVRHRVGRELVL